MHQHQHHRGTWARRGWERSTYYTLTWTLIYSVILTFECLFALLPVFRLAGWFNYFGKQSCFFGDMQIHQIDSSVCNKKQNKTPNAIWSLINYFLKYKSATKRWHFPNHQVDIFANNWVVHFCDISLLSFLTTIWCVWGEHLTNDLQQRQE